MTPVEDVSGGPCGWCRTTHSGDCDDEPPDPNNSLSDSN